MAAHRRTSASELLRTLPADEWPLWVAFCLANNIGPRGDDDRAGTAAASVRSALGVPTAAADLFPSLRPQHRPRKPGERGVVHPGVESFLTMHCPALAGL